MARGSQMEAKFTQRGGGWRTAGEPLTVTQATSSEHPLCAELWTKYWGEKDTKMNYTALKEQNTC